MVKMKKRIKEPISNSDWLVYLQSKNSHLIGIMFPLSTIYIVISIAIIQINLQLGGDEMPTTVGGITIFLVAMLLIIVFLVGSATMPYVRLQKRIITGELANHKEILEAFEKIENKEFHETVLDELKIIASLFKPTVKKRKRSKK